MVDMQHTAAVQNRLNEQLYSMALSLGRKTSEHLHKEKALCKLSLLLPRCFLCLGEMGQHYQLLDQTSTFILHSARDVIEHAQAMNTDARSTY